MHTMLTYELQKGLIEERLREAERRPLTKRVRTRRVRRHDGRGRLRIAIAVLASIVVAPLA
jgi:hypothetical protein